jgi:hypothetical protein
MVSKSSFSILQSSLTPIVRGRAGVSMGAPARDPLVHALTNSDFDCVAKRVPPADVWVPIRILLLFQLITLNHPQFPDGRLHPPVDQGPRANGHGWPGVPGRARRRRVTLDALERTSHRQLMRMLVLRMVGAPGLRIIICCPLNWGGPIGLSRIAARHPGYP